MNKIFLAILFAGIFSPSSSLTETRRSPYFGFHGSDDTEEADDYLDDLQANPLLSNTDYSENETPCNLQQESTFENENQFELSNGLELEPENYEKSNDDSSGIQLELIEEEDDKEKIDEVDEAKAKHFVDIKIFETDIKYGGKQEDPQEYAEPTEQQLPYHNNEMEQETMRPSSSYSNPTVNPKILALLRHRELKERHQQERRERNQQEQLKLKEQQRLRDYKIQRAEYLQKLQKQKMLLFYQKRQAQRKAARRDQLPELTPQQKAYYKRGLDLKRRSTYFYI